MRKSNHVLRSKTLSVLAALAAISQTVQGGKSRSLKFLLAEVTVSSVSAVNTWLRSSSDSNLRANRVSLEGGTEVVILGQGLDATPLNNRVEFECYDRDDNPFGTENVPGPELSSKISRFYFAR